LLWGGDGVDLFSQNHTFLHYFGWFKFFIQPKQGIFVVFWLNKAVS